MAPPKPPATPKFTVPPAQTKSAKAFAQFVAKWGGKYPGLRQWASQIVQYAAENHIDPVYFASVLMTESRVNAQTPNSSAGAVGIGQIMPIHIGEFVPWDATRTQRVTAADLRNPVFNLRLSAYILGQQVGNYGYQNAYAGDPNIPGSGYNHGWTPASGGLDPLSRIPHGYLPGVTSPGTSGAPGAGTATGAAATTTASDRWVVVTPKGVVKVVAASTPPKNAVKDATGQAYNLSNWQQVQNSLDTIYLAYTGRRATAKSVAAYIKQPVSDYQLQLQLSDPAKNALFFKSPIWETHAPEYEAVYKSIFGNNADTTTPAARQAITYAVVHNLSQTGFQQRLRDRPDYNTSEEYKASAASFHAVYSSIYGEPDQNGHAAIDKAVRQGMSGDQFAQYLRAQPEYTGSGEFRGNVYNLMAGMGLIPGGGPQAPGVGGAAPPPVVPSVPVGAGLSG